MEALTLCWIFDKRWLFGIANPCIEYLLIVPITLDLLTIAGIIIERHSIRLQVGQYIISLIALYSILALLSLYLLLRTYFLSEQRLEDVAQNYQAIREFTHHFQSKKSIWSLAGLLMTTLGVGQIVINHLYIEAYISTYACLANRIRFWLDIASWGYIALIVLIFLLCKLIFLFVSWKRPEFYLEYKDVI